MKVAVIECPVWGTREPPLAIVQLAGSLKSNGFDVRAFDFNNYLYRNRSEKFNTIWAWEQSMSWYDREWVEKFFKDFKEVVEEYSSKIIEYKPDIIGFAVSASTFQSSIQLANIIKTKLPDITIIFGGPAYIDEEYIDHSFRSAAVDYIIPGDADEVFPGLVSCIDTGKNIAECKGIYYKDNHNIIFSGDFILPENLNKLPYMDFTDLRIEDYDDPLHVSIMSTRGCIWNCAYCSTRNFNKQYRKMSAERMHQEITFHRIHNYDRGRKDNLGHVDFFDLEFNGDIKRVIEFCDLMIKYPPIQFLPKMRWVSNAIIHKDLTSDILKKMEKAGCKKLIFGIESGSERVLKLMRKPQKIDIVKRIIKDAYNAGIEVTTNFMFGFPGETEEDFQKTLELVEEIGSYVERVYPSRTYCAVEQFSYLQQHLDEFKIKTPVNHHLYWETLDKSNTYPVRLDRCSRFEKFCDEHNIRVDCGVKTSVDMDNWYNLAFYYDYMKDHEKTVEFILKYLKKDPKNEAILNKLKEIYKAETDEITNEQKSLIKKYL